MSAPGKTLSSATEAVTDCILCGSGVVELLSRSPTRECEHTPDVCIDCLNRSILKAFKKDCYMVCPSKDCSRRMSRTDAQLWVTPTEPGQHVAPYSPGYGKSTRPLMRRDEMALPTDSARTRPHPVPGYGGQQIRDVEGHCPRFCDDCAIPLHTNFKHRECCRYHGGSLHNNTPLETAFNGANGYRSGSVARMNYVQPPAPLPTLHFEQNTTVQNGNAAYNGENYGLAGAPAFLSPGAHALLPAFAPPQRWYAEPSSSSSQTGGTSRGNWAVQINTESVYRYQDVSRPGSSPNDRTKTPENTSTMDWQPAS